MLFALACASTLSACATNPPESPTPAPAAESAPPAPAAAKDRVVYAYPLQNQSYEQQDRDRYECHLWAVKQSGFDPSAPSLAPHTRVRVVSAPPPETSVPGAAVTGAVLGAVVGGPHSAGEGAVVGAVAGAMIGAAADSQRNERIRDVEERSAAVQRERNSAVELKADDYRRAISACLGGRGYSTQ